VKLAKIVVTSESARLVLECIDIALHARSDTRAAVTRLETMGAPALDSPLNLFYAFAANTTAFYANTTAFYDLAAGGAGADALPLAEYAAKTDPHSAAIQDTYGWALIETGKIADGLSWNAAALRGDLEPAQHASVRCVRAIGLMRSGDRSSAVAELERARSLDMACPLLPRVEAELAPTREL
jgi:hypothetical protein